MSGPERERTPDEAYAELATAIMALMPDLSEEHRAELMELWADYDRRRRRGEEAQGDPDPLAALTERIANYAWRSNLQHLRLQAATHPVRRSSEALANLDAELAASEAERVQLRSQVQDARENLRRLARTHEKSD